MTVLKTFFIGLWQACDALYNRHRDLCLRLQDDHGVNVNLLLLALWLDGHEYGLSASQWQILLRKTQDWEAPLLSPFRKLRKLSKSSLAESEYRQMLDVELMLERKSQGLILRRLKRLENEGECQNLDTYLSLFDLGELDVSALRE